MSERHQFIIEAAERVFSRYGVSRATMADIAAEAGVARQTVYNAYQNKDELLCAVIRANARMTEEKVLAGWNASTSFEEKLAHFFQTGPLCWYDTIEASPDAADLIEGIHRVAELEMQEAGTRWKAHFSKLIQDHFDTRALDVDALADFIYSTSLNAKSSVSNRNELEQRLAILKHSVVALLAPSVK